MNFDDETPDLSVLSPEKQQALIALSTEQGRQERLAKQKAAAQHTLSEGFDASNARTAGAGLAMGLGELAKKIHGRIDSDKADATAQQYDAQHTAGLGARLDLASQMQQAAALQRRMQGQQDILGANAKQGISGIGPDAQGMQQMPQQSQGQPDDGQALQPQDIMAALSRRQSQVQDPYAALTGSGMQNPLAFADDTDG